MSFRSNPETSRLRSVDRMAVPPRAALDRAALDLGATAEWTDEALMAAIAEQDVRAFALIYDRYVDLVFSTALRVLASREYAEDMVQEVFVRIWTRPEAFVPERGRFMSWLISVVRNRSVDELRAQGRRRRREVLSENSLDDTGHNDPPDDEEPSAAVPLTEERRCVRRALHDLPIEQRRALELAYFAGLTHQEIARTLHEPLGTIKTRIRLGMQKMRRALTEELA